ncbi:MAG: GntR family transcriptional regulator [Antricoccus sp.]
MYASKTDMVTAKLREMIIGGELRAAVALRQRDLANQLGVSQTPVREALRRLESEGLVSNDPYKGSVVAEARLGLWGENYAIRAELEGLAAQFACDVVTRVQLDELRALDEQMRAIGHVDDDYHRLNQEFHMRICEIADSPMLLSFIKLLWRALGSGPQVVRTHAESCRQHRQIIAALNKRDKSVVDSLLHNHILGAKIDQR